MPSSSKKVLIIDDDPFLVKLLEFTLKERGYQVTTAGNGWEGFQKIGDTRFDIVIVDLVMPGLNGFEFVTRMKKLPHCADTPVLIITARTAAQDPVEAKTVGAEGILLKPFTPEEFLLRIKALLEKTAED